MTIEEKRDALDKLCESHEPCCIDNGRCPLYNHPLRGIDCDSDNSEEIEQLYEIAFGANHATDPVTHPSHYTQGNIQCIDAMVSAFGNKVVANWCKCNAFKYLWREEHKNGMEDIDKAIWYLNKFKELSASG